MFKKLFSFSTFVFVLLFSTNVASASLLTEDTETPENPYVVVDTSDEADELDRAAGATAELLCELFDYPNPEELFFDDDEFMMDLIDEIYPEYGFDFEDIYEWEDLLDEQLMDHEGEYLLSTKIRETCPGMAEEVIDEVGLRDTPPEPEVDTYDYYDYEEAEISDETFAAFSPEKRAFISATVEATCLIFNAEDMFDPELENQAKEIYKKYGFDADDEVAMEELTSKYQNDPDVNAYILDAIEECSEGFLSSIEEEEIEYKEPLYDVAPDHKNHDAIFYLYDEGIIWGYPDGSFKPDQDINRAEFLKILIEAKEYYPPSYYSNCFPDVLDDWYASYVCYAKEMGWVDGYEDGLFRPEQTVNKVEALKMLLEVYSSRIDTPWEVTIAPYLDTPLDAWYVRYVAKAKELGILEETGEYFNPGQNMTRGGVSENMYRLLLWFEDNYLDQDPEFLALVEQLRPGILDLDSVDWDFQLTCDQQYYDTLEEILEKIEGPDMVLSDYYYDDYIVDVLVLWEPDPVYVSANSGCLDILESYLDEGADVDQIFYQWSGYAPLHLAAQNGDMEMVKMLLDRGADIDVVAQIYENYYELVFTPLYYAIDSGYLDVAEYLIDEGADMDKINAGDYSSLLNSAVESQSLEMVNWLLNEGFDANESYDIGWTALHSACSGANLDIVKALVQAGADMNAQDYYGLFPIGVSMNYDRPENALYLIEQGADVNLISSEIGKTPLHEAAYFGQLEVAQALIDAGAKVNATNFYNETPLYAGVSGANLDLIQLLIDNGADLEIPDQQGFTPLHLAASLGELEVLDLLIDNGADVNGTYVSEWSPIRAAVTYSEQIEIVQALIDAGGDVNLADVLERTPLHEASYNGFVDIMNLLIDEGAQVDVQESYGETPLYSSVAGGIYDSVDALIIAGADMNIADEYGFTPLHLAVELDEVNIMELLVASGAEVNALDDYGNTPKDFASSDVMLQNLPVEAKYSDEL
ncbi:ankyrin repeat domain-containing protein [Patescibacteria group bacterium]